MGIMRFTKVKAIASCIFLNMSEHDFAASNAGRFFIGEICSRRICEVLTELKTDLYREKVNPHAFE